LFFFIFLKFEKKKKRMSQDIDNAVADVLTSKRLKLVHPGDGRLTQVYATSSEVTSMLAEAVNHRGQYRVASNNLALGAQSNFIISTSAIITDMYLVFNITAPSGDFFSHSGWGFDLIESVEVTYANSLMQNMVIRGDIMKEYSKLCCCSVDELQQMLDHAGPMEANRAGATLTAAVPLSFLNNNTSGLRSSWPTDSSVLAGPIQISVNWVSSAVSARIFINSTTIEGTLPTAVGSAEITCTTITLQRAAFGVKNAMMKDPSLVYSIPSRYLSIVNESRSNLGAVTDPISINLNSAPAGMLEAILIYAAPADPNGTDWVNGDRAGVHHGGSLRIDNLRLQFGSQDLIRYRNREEMLAFNRSNFGNSLSYKETIVPTGVDVDAIPVFHQATSDIIVLPMCQNGKGVFNGHINEHLASYGGSQLQLTMQFQDTRGEVSAGRAFGAEGDETVTATTIQIWICYVISAILEVSQGTVDLQL
jgi:hypothetical protein